NGTYNAMLEIYDSSGCYDTTSVLITITNARACNIIAGFSYTIGSNGQVTFTNTSTGGGVYSWNFGDGGTSATPSPIYVYSYNGVYYCTLTATNDSGCISNHSDSIVITNDSANICNLTASFNYSTGSNGLVTYNSTPTGVTASTVYYWLPGDGTSWVYSGGVNSGNHTYLKNGTYYAELYISDSIGGCSSTAYDTIVITNDSISTCALNPSYIDSMRANGQVIFYSTSTGITSNTVYSWDPGDGSGYTSGTGMTTYSHNYSYNGTYYATLHLYDSTLGCSNSISSYLTITTDTAYNPYDTCLYANFADTVYYTDSLGHIDSVSFYSISDTLCNDSTLRAIKHSSHIPIVYSWDFGDGQKLSGVGIDHNTHSYSKNGMYIVTLTINHSGSKSKSTSTRVINVSPASIATVNKPNAELKLFPNPNNGTFKVAINGIEGNQNAELQITNLLGEVVYTTSAHSTNGMIMQDVNLAGVSAGTYFVRVITSDKVYNTKAIINR
ncbi:MAG TPA: PKD domain-containing protein, partial [Bacteroidia bacterium]|nr:PKD domain-containing protein [Bacteroidia bacterium]